MVRTDRFDAAELMQAAADRSDDRENLPMRLSVARVNRREDGTLEITGNLASGTVSPGNQITAALTGATATVSAIFALDGAQMDRAQAGCPVTLVLAKDVAVSPGELLADAAARPEVSDQFAAHVVWLSEGDLMPGRSYLLKSGEKTVTATVTELKYKIDLETSDHLAAKVLHKDEVALCNLALSETIAFDSFETNRATGSFVLIDRLTDQTVAAGAILFGLRRATNIHRQALDVDQAARSRMKQQKPVILWFTGLSGSGKSTIANALETQLFARNCHTHLLDGDNVRHGLNRDLGFTDADRVENIRRIGEVAKLFVEAGIIVLVSFISPFRSERRMAREMVGEDEFFEIFVDTPIEECIKRDPKGLYKKAEAGQIKNFTGIDSPYEIPETAELTLSTLDHTADELAGQIIDYLVEKRVLSGD